MTAPTSWPVAPPLSAARLDLEPLTIDHVDAAMEFLDDPALHEFTGGRPATREELRGRFTHQVVGHSADGSEGWLNWVLRERATGRPCGTVQATVTRGHHGELRAALAWVVGSEQQGRGYAREAAIAMIAWLREQGVDVLTASIHPDHEASARVARAVGLRPTPEVVDGEVTWTG